MKFINYTINAPREAVLANLAKNDEIVALEKFDLSNGKPTLRIKRNEDRLTLRCELTERATKDNAFLEGTYFKGKIIELDGVTTVKGIILTAPIYHLFLLALTVFFIVQCISVGGFSPVPIILIGFSLLMFRTEFKKQGIIKAFIFRALKMTYADETRRTSRQKRDTAEE